MTTTTDRNPIRRRALPGVLAAITLLGCVPTARVTMDGANDIGANTMERYDGPKARVAVVRFKDKTAKGWWSGEIGDGMADMLATALVNTGRYITLERRQLGDVIAEQDIGASGRVNRATRARIGGIEGAEMLVTGAITEFEPNAGGANLGAAVSGLPYGNYLGMIAGAFKQAHVAIDLRAVDARTSRIVFATSVEGSATDVAGIGSFAPVALGGFSKTPMEKAIRVAINEAAKAMVAKTPTQYFHFDGRSRARRRS